jgi:predicted nucleic acid-binding protein
VSDLLLFDTDVLIDAGRGLDAAMEAIQEAEARSLSAVSTVTQMELIVGCRNKAELEVLEGFLARFLILPLDPAISTQATHLLRRYRLSHGLSIPDALIAATALTEDIPLVSKNQRDYRFIEGLDLLPYPEPFAP